MKQPVSTIARRAAPKPARVPSGDRLAYSPDEGQTFGRGAPEPDEGLA